MSLFSPPRRVQDGSWWSCGVCSKDLSGDLLMLRLSLQGLSFLMLAS